MRRRKLPMSIGREAQLTDLNQQPSLKLTAKAPENRPFAPKGKDRIPISKMLVSRRVPKFGTFSGRVLEPVAFSLRTLCLVKHQLSNEKRAPGCFVYIGGMK